MSETQLENMTDKPRNITCFIKYNDQDNLETIFNTLKDFKSKHGLKWSHHKDIIFFQTGSDKLEEFSQVQKFKISKYQAEATYKCSKEDCDKLMNQKDSFLRMRWDEENNTVIFLSRTTFKVHRRLIRRIFTDSEVEFDKDSFSVDIQVSNQNGTPSNQQNTVDNNEEGFVRAEKKKRVTTKKFVKEEEETPVKPLIRKGRPKKE